MSTSCHWSWSVGYCIGEKVRGEVNYICLYICWLSFLFLFFLALNLLLFCAKPGEVDSGVEMTCLSLSLSHCAERFFPPVSVWILQRTLSFFHVCVFVHKSYCNVKCTKIDLLKKKLWFTATRKGLDFFLYFLRSFLIGIKHLFLLNEFFFSWISFLGLFLSEIVGNRVAKCANCQYAVEHLEIGRFDRMEGSEF